MPPTKIEMQAFSFVLKVLLLLLTAILGIGGWTLKEVVSLSNKYAQFAGTQEQIQENNKREHQNFVDRLNDLAKVHEQKR
jgi:hypothetical protein